MLLQKKRFRDNPLAADLDHILALTEGLWEELRGQRLFITGGTGFFGCWLLESFAWANQHLDLKASALVLTRNAAALRWSAPHLADDPAIRFHIGDIRDFAFPEGEFTHIIHAATTSAVATFQGEDPLVKFDTIVQGTRRALDFALQCRARKFLYTSSGAVYGSQPPEISHLAEDCPCAPDPADLNAALGEGKRAAEFLTGYYSARYGIETRVARCFSFVGPYLPLDIHYAIGNFIRDGLQGGPIQVRGDGAPYRSYLYAADLAVWLWTVLFNGKKGGVYNVGSEAEVSIGDLAQAVADCFEEQIEVRVATPSTPGALPQRYVPSTRRARETLGLRQEVDLRSAVARTIAFARTIQSGTGE